MFTSLSNFIREIYNTPKGSIPLHAPLYSGNEEAYVADAVRAGETSAYGSFIGKFEKALADYTGSPHAVAVANGTAALHVALHLCGVRKDEEVITQALTFVATGNAILYTGAHPILVDADRDTMGMSPSSLSSFLKENAKVKNGEVINKTTGRRIAAVLPMHTLGFPARITEIKDICDEWNLPLIEDAAEALGSKVGGQHVGTFGRVGVFSFNGNKTITTGGGGALLLQDAKDAERIRYLISTAKRPHTYEYFHTELGFNYAMPNLNAALGLAQMEHLSEMLYRKGALTYIYGEHLQHDGIRIRTEIANTKANNWLITIELKDRNERTQLLDALNQQGITARPIWTLLNKMPAFQHCQTTDLTNSQWLEDRIVNLPSGLEGVMV